jgi:pimeloyl-ACP methyl ester carboxylesterase
MGYVHCVIDGPDLAMPLVLLHQTPRSVDEYAEVMPILARARRVIAIDTPGYGCSDRVAGQPTVTDYANAIVESLTALGVRRAIVVGHHTGAVIALEMAAAHAALVERVVLSGPVYTDAAGRAALLPYFKQWTIARDGSHLGEKFNKFMQWISRPDLVQRLTVDLFRAGTASEQGHIAVAHYHMEDRVQRRLCPALLLFHEHDPFAQPSQVAPLRAAFHPCREATLAAGVFAANEAPEAFARAVLDYVSGPP